MATHHLGEFAEMDRRVEEARRRYVEAESLSRGIGYQNGIETAKASLRRIGDGQENGDD